ncbi:hypothetical protein FOG51_00171 [Hanseniaspora uvarum]|uniref:Protein PRY2 n=1 Tax=Hanseniaspora uvarum TaxID=29833 RepID=A0A1E5RIS9_HANUV|nr:hypothetical protein FOG48_02798 [Hanseniaspora uvarum]KAF0274993.1 hypothetical protein FOG51_00171 [Hanseniaspora uvarum]KKA02332.1 hypothetical protein D499_0K00430 [Hanseniaspora uvarum DSM 2768]OEJ86775.1 Protein PRY2 [Hanseniaspora uvarum]
MLSLISTTLLLSTVFNSHANAITIEEQDSQSIAQSSHSHKAKVTDVVLTTILLTVSVDGTLTETFSDESVSAETGVVINNANVALSSSASTTTSTTNEYTIPTISLSPSSTATSTTSEYVAPTTSTESSSSTEPSSSTEDQTTSTSVASPTVVSSTSSDEPSSTTSSSSSSTATSSFASSMLSQHNAKRALHKDTDSLSWSSNLENIAQAYADSYDCSGTLTHSGKPYGENLALGYPLYDGETGIAAWYDEIKNYDFSDPGFSDDTGHFTQVVWKDTTQVGCGYKQCSNEWGIYLVCNYLAQGNIIGEFSSNVEELIN